MLKLLSAQGSDGAGELPAVPEAEAEAEGEVAVDSVYKGKVVDDQEDDLDLAGLDDGFADMQQTQNAVLREDDSMGGGLGRYFHFFQALAHDPSERHGSDVEAVFEGIRHISDPFIVKLEDHVKRAMCKRLSLEEYEASTRIFDYGDYGDRLYMIWSGRVMVEVPRRSGDHTAPIGQHTELIKIGYLDAGKTFGELALMSEDQRRSARITAVKPTQLLVLQKQDYLWCIGGSQQNFVSERLDFLKSVDRATLEGVPEVDLKAMANHLLEERYSNQEVVLRQGEEVDRVIFVKGGFCKVLRQFHPKFKEAFNAYADKHAPVSNPYTSSAPSGGGSSGSAADVLGASVGSGGGRRASIASVASSVVGRSDASAAAGRRPSVASVLKRAPTMETIDGRRGTVTTIAAFGDGLADKGTNFHDALEDLLREQQATETTSNGRQAAATTTPRGARPTPGGASSSVASVRGGLLRPRASSGTAASLEPAAISDRDAVLSSEQVVIVDCLEAGRSFGIMEMMEGLSYQCTVVADPWAELYTISKFDLLRNTSKAVLHRLFCDYKARLDDTRLLNRLRQKSKWTGYKLGLLDEIQNRKRTTSIRGVDRREAPRRTGAGNLSMEDFARVGADDKLWDKRAQTPPRPAYVNKSNARVQHVFYVECVRDAEGRADVLVEREMKDASITALDEKRLVAIATARFRDQFKKESVMAASAAAATGGAGTAALRDTASADGPRRSSKEARSPAGASASPASVATRTPRGGGVTTTAQQRNRGYENHPVVQAQELDERAKRAAHRYLAERTNHIREHAKVVEASEMADAMVARARAQLAEGGRVRPDASAGAEPSPRPRAFGRLSALAAPLPGIGKPRRSVGLALSAR
eukprot:TRINITY_DN6028_c0_g1_i1.p1 TRINITY_DN6028_c0_g1~~TRINITY_DN6028_c0_g1_i1.p1  ORF type:complete len:871 (+),score=213.49 TRINITY_DN6028_c0_g1_i1:83-2695(+)